MLSFNAMVLAAGFGNRLRPLTAHTPKPLLPFAGVSLLELNLLRAQRAGAENIFVNSHYQAEKIFAEVEKLPTFIKKPTITYEPQILGSGGAFKLLPKNSNKSPLLVLNGDIVSDFDTLELIKKYTEKPSADLCLSLKPSSTSGGRKIRLAPSSTMVVAFEKSDHSKLWDWSCSKVISASLLDDIQSQQPWDIIEFYGQKIGEGSLITGFKQKGFWYDIGQPSTYWAAHMNLLEEGINLIHRLGLNEFWQYNQSHEFITHNNNKLPNIQPPCILPKNIQLPNDTTIGPFVCIQNLVELPKKCTISKSVLLENAGAIKPQMQIHNSVVGDQFCLRVGD